MGCGPLGSGVSARAPLALAVALALVGSVVLTPPVHAEISISFEAQTLEADGLTPYADAAVYGLSRGRVGWRVSTLRVATLVNDDNGDGLISLDLPRAPSGSSVWAVIELQSGEMTVSPGPGGRLREVDSPANALSGSGGTVQHLAEEGRPYLEMVVVRPGSGAWIARLGDGGPADADGVNNGHIHAQFADMSPLGGSGSPPATLQPPDLLLVVDTRTLEFYRIRLGGDR